ncbi:MAG: hypothetical protein ABSC48_10495 [Terracidiphilus sp.]
MSIWSHRRISFIFGLTMLLLSSGYRANAQPAWTQLWQPGQPADYFKYSGSTATVMQNSIYTPRPQYDYSYQTLENPSPLKRSCQIWNQPGLYWFYPPGSTDANGNDISNQTMNGQYPGAIPAEYTMTTSGSPLTGVKGIQGTLDFYGSGSGQGFQETLYFTNRYCVDGSTEYGLWKEITTGVIYFYWSTATNCGSDCHSANSPYSSNVFQMTDEVSVTNLGPNSLGDWRWNYQMYMVPDASNQNYSFTIAVKDPFTGALAQCSLNGGPVGNCTWSGLEYNSWWYPTNAMYNSSGYVAVGTASSGSNSLSNAFLSALSVSVGH